MKIIITAGGTGGHIFPALSVALELIVKDSSIDLLWIGTGRSREKELCNLHGISFVELDVVGINRSNPLSAVKAIIKMLLGYMRTRGIFKTYRPDTVIAFGGYVCAPVVAIAKHTNVPYYLQEQNTVPGLVNRFFAATAKTTFLGFVLNDKWKLKGKIKLTGTPVRKRDDSYLPSLYHNGIDIKKRTILICGGSQGAASMNDAIVSTVKVLSEGNNQIIWQTGLYSFEKLSKIFLNKSNVHIYESFEDLYPYYSIAKFVICRSGASTLSEIVAFALPCIMIPLPWSTENHQLMNAAYIEQEGWGVSVKQNEKCGDMTLEIADRFLSDDTYFNQLKNSANKHSTINAASIIVDTVFAEVNAI